MVKKSKSQCKYNKYKTAMGHHRDNSELIGRQAQVL